MQSYLRQLDQALAGNGELILGIRQENLPTPLPDGVTVVVTTSGSTSGTGRPVGLTSAALTASAQATHERLNGPGQWLLALPSEHIAGVQVCARSLLAGYTPIVRGQESLAEAISRMDPGTRHYTSLVPTQLVRILAQGGEDLRALASMDAILLGGSAVDPTLLGNARRAGLTILTTYGSTETSGGCVYDGRPLKGVNVRIDDDARIWLSGPTLAWGYLDDAPSDFYNISHTRWFRTSDLGTLNNDGTLTVLGRADDVIISGGTNVHPVAVEHILGQHPAVRDCVVVGLASEEWGAEVVAIITVEENSAEPTDSAEPTGRDEPTLLSELRANVRAALGNAAPPRALICVPELPSRGPGKIDRREAAEIAHRAFTDGFGTWHHT